MGDIKAFDEYRDNGYLIAAVKELGYIRDDDEILDTTYGLGVFWSQVGEPVWFSRNDLDPKRGDMHFNVRDLSCYFSNHYYDVVVFDPPYKLNGTDRGEGARYGVAGENVRWQDRMDLMHAGFVQCARVCKVGGIVLFKLQDQVSSGKVRWQRFHAWDWAKECGLELVDMLDMLGGRPQPAGRKQMHARRNSSTLMVFRKYNNRRRRQ